MENNQKSFEESLIEAQANAKKGHFKFKVLSGIWIVVSIIVLVFFAFFLNKLEKNAQSITELAVGLEKQAKNLEIQAIENQKLNDRIIGLEEYYYSQLNKTAKESKLKDIAQLTMNREYITPGQKQFLNSEKNAPVDSNNANYWYLEAFNKDNEEAIEYFKKAIALDPEMKDAYFAIGLRLNSLKKYNEAIANFTEALKFGYNPSYALAARSFSYFKLSYDPNHTPAQQEDFLMKSLDNCEKSIQFDPTYWVPYHYKGFIDYKRKDFKSAEIDWREAAKRRIGLSETAGSLENISLIYLSNQEWKRAFENCMEVKQIYEDRTWNWLFLYIASSKLNQRRSAKIAKKKWDNAKSESDITALQLYLPKELHKYL